MKIEEKHRIQKLKSKSFDEIDHLSILQNIYDQFNDGHKQYYLLARYFINGLDDIPTLKQKSLWEPKAFELNRNTFYNSHKKLIEIIETYYELDGEEKLVQEFHSNENIKIVYIEKRGKINGVFDDIMMIPKLR